LFANKKLFLTNKLLSHAQVELSIIPKSNMVLLIKMLKNKCSAEKVLLRVTTTNYQLLKNLKLVQLTLTKLTSKINSKPSVRIKEHVKSTLTTGHYQLILRYKQVLALIMHLFTFSHHVSFQKLKQMKGKFSD